ncbi:hypothetical protein HYU11_05670 [Candidatus Woesearchaeota archaeon]|nr:hypothetical protein [Candidatus Woesearchaeota archaeon]
MNEKSAFAYMAYDGSMELAGFVVRAGGNPIDDLMAVCHGAIEFYKRGEGIIYVNPSKGDLSAPVPWEDALASLDESCLLGLVNPRIDHLIMGPSQVDEYVLDSGFPRPR